MVEQTSKRVRRVVVESPAAKAITGTVGVIGFTPFELGDCPPATWAKIVSYGVSQLVNDALAGEDDKEAALTAVIGKFKSGDWSVTRGASGASGLTLEAVAVDMIKSAAKAKGKSLTVKEAKGLATQLLADEARLPKVEAELQRRKAEAEEIDLGDLI